jgi:hypothetical protein
VAFIVLPPGYPSAAVTLATRRGAASNHPKKGTRHMSKSKKSKKDDKKKGKKGKKGKKK